MSRTEIKGMLTVAHCKELHKRLGGAGVVVIHFGSDDGEFGVAEWGANRSECAELKRWVDDIFSRIDSGKIPAPFKRWRS